MRRVAANGGWWLAERFALLGLTLVTSVVIVRALGPAQYGELSYVLALVGLLAPLAQFGVSGLVARALLEKPGTMRPCFGRRCCCDSRDARSLRGRSHLVGLFRGTAS